MLKTTLAHPAIASALQKLADQEPKAAAFGKALFSRAETEDVDGLDPALLAELARTAYGHCQTRKAPGAKIAVQPMAGFNVILIANDDMPFLVDSVMGLVSETGTDIRLVLHPVIRVSRKNGEISALLDDGTGSAESFILVLTARLAKATADKLEHDIAAALEEVRLAVQDWKPMQQRVEEAIHALENHAPKAAADEIAESAAFLRWLLANHFTLLGIREYKVSGRSLVPASTALGILKNPNLELLHNPKDAETAFFADSSSLFITKSDVTSSVHRRALMDYCGVKLYGPDGKPEGELAIAGLFTSSAYTQSPQEIPLVREKIAAILKASGLPADSHSGKALTNVLETYPRDELLQTARAELEPIVLGILRLEERPRPRLFARRDRFDRLISAFVFLPRDRFNTELREKVGAILEGAYAAKVKGFQPTFGEGALVRVHYLLARSNSPATDPDTAALEAAIVQASRSWNDRLADALQEGTIEPGQYISAFPAGYRDTTAPEQAVDDVAILNALGSEDDIAAHFTTCATGSRLKLRLHRLHQAIPLSARLPILENMGLKAIEESTHTLTNGSGPLAFIHEVILEPAKAVTDPVRLELLRAGFLAVWKGEAENDGYNALILDTGMTWQEVALLRALGRYLRQAGIPFSNAYIAQCLVKHSAIARLIFALFRARFAGNGETQSIAEDIAAALQKVPSLDDDRILRRFKNLVDAMQRTNYFARRAGAALAFKFASRQIEGLPEPRPFAEIFVYSPDIEGVHLRFGAIARGGLRWSDRPEDFRTEVLGLVKAQNVKNAVIVPVGAKGGFVPKKLALMQGRDAVAAEGLRCYRIFIESLLSLTDNLMQGKPVPPAGLVRHDGDDPYLVVAADKGTASFSDEANAIAQAHGFWLDDAFASGGSAGYDHKKMGITARGAFVAVERHFRELDRNIHAEPFTVAGVGDMSGDVFGNGMLLTQEILLVAAFDHRDIFIDPTPDAAKSHAERSRMFSLPRSSWQDFDKSVLSKGGGVYSRQEKSVPLSEEARALLGITQAEPTPQEVIQAILRLPVDLLWFGGIGTYVKSAQESHADVGDKANDALRVNAIDLRARVIGEGANLGLTQAARIEYARAGGRINTDAVDNSAGVNSSDYEVNIKIALGAAMQAGKLTRPQRDSLLASMTDDVAKLVLRNNRLQTLCLTLARARASDEAGYDGRMMRRLEARGELNRQIEFLPDDNQLKERELKGEGLTRPELAVLMAYAKLSIHDQLLESGLTDDAYFARELSTYFPIAVMNAFGTEVSAHPLRRQIIATLLANSMVNRLGPSFPERILEETGASAEALARAYALARDCFGFRVLQSEADQLPIPHAARLELLLELQLLLRQGTVWFLRHVPTHAILEPTARQYRDGVADLRKDLASLLPPSALLRLQERHDAYLALGLEPETAGRFAALRLLQRGPDIVQAAQNARRPLPEVAKVFFASSAELGVDRLLGLTGQITPADFYERLAINGLVDQIFQNHRSVVASAVAAEGGWDGWKMKRQSLIRQFEESLADMTAEKRFTLARLSVATHELAAIAAQ